MYLRKSKPGFSLALLLAMAVTLFVAFSSCGKSSSELLTEYDMLFEDLENYKLCGFKSYMQKDFFYCQGTLMETGESLNFAIEGEGFFRVRNVAANRFLYTRDGAFLFNENGYIVNRDGYYLDPPVKLNLDYPMESYVLEGNVLRLKADTAAFSNHVFTLYVPVKRSAIKRQKNYFVFSKSMPVSNSRIFQGFVELSTVDILPVITRMHFIIKEIESRKLFFTGIETKELILEQLIKNVMERQQQLAFYRIMGKMESARWTNETDKMLYAREMENWYDPVEKMIPFLKRDYE